MAEKKSKTTKKAAAKKTETAPSVEAASEAKPPKAVKPKKEKAPKEDLVVFAFRLTEAERDLIHKTAGPRNATQFVRRIAVAFASEDEVAFRTVIKEARDLRS